MVVRIRHEHLVDLDWNHRVVGLVEDLVVDNLHFVVVDNLRLVAVDSLLLVVVENHPAMDNRLVAGIPLAVLDNCHFLDIGPKL